MKARFSLAVLLCLIIVAALPRSALAEPIKLDPLSLVLGASGPVFAVVWLLIAAAALVWVITVLKARQLSRWLQAERLFEEEALAKLDKLEQVARHHPDAIGSQVVAALAQQRRHPEILEAVAERALVGQQQRLFALMPTLSSIGAAAPFVGLFGTVYGIMDAFLRIGNERSASLPVVAPAIGEALIATAIGLFAAIPAVVAYNGLAGRLEGLLQRTRASSRGWLRVLSEEGSAHRR